MSEVPDPEPGPGEVLVRSLACGICGSDLHALRYGKELAQAAQESGVPFSLDPARDLVMGHEFCAEVLDYGPGTSRRIPLGRRVVSMPVLPRAGRIEGIGYSSEVPGGFGERMVLAEALLLEVPEPLATERAALTEPMAVALHAVARARLEPGERPIVVGCGPVGLAVIAALRLAGIGPIVASEPSAARRRRAQELGADVVVDPEEESPFVASARQGGGGRAVVFECVGRVGMIGRLMREAPRDARLIVAGVCMQEDRLRPLYGISKELQIQFVLGYTPQEFAESLAALADGRLPADPLVTGKVGLSGVADAFRELENPQAHVKILVEPWRA